MRIKAPTRNTEIYMKMLSEGFLEHSVFDMKLEYIDFVYFLSAQEYIHQHFGRGFEPVNPIPLATPLGVTVRAQ